MKANWFDDFVGFFSPRAKLKRLQYKKAVNVAESYKRKYEGATRGRRTKNWRTGGADANKEIFGSLGMLRNRSRDLVRNNPYAERGIRLIESNTIGKGIIAQIKADSRLKQRRFESRWRQWADTTAIDFDGRHNLAGLQRVVARAIAEGGEVIVRKRRVRGGPVPIKLQVLEGDFINDLTTVMNLADRNNTVIQGVEFDPQGAIVAYHLFKEHPGALRQGTNIKSNFKSNFISQRIPAEDVIHVFRQDRPGQARGVPWLAPVMLRLRDFDEFEDAQLVRQKIAACFTAFIKDHEMPETSTEDDKSDLGDKLEPGALEFLPPGKDITFADPPELQNYKEYVNTMLRSISVGLGVSFEAMTGDLSDVNFSSARMGWLEMQRNIDSWRWQLIIPQFLDRTFEWFLEGVELAEGFNPEGVSAAWTPPRREMIDPTKEVPAKIKEIRAGITTLSETIRLHGGDPNDQLQEMSEDFNLIDELGLTLDSDPRKVSQNGSLQGSAGSGASQSESEGDEDNV